MDLFLGVDGCRAGWLIAPLDGDGQLHPIKVVRHFEDVISEVGSSRLTLIDIPIGLITCGPEARRCDTEARGFIGPRRSSVFPVPCRRGIYTQSWEASYERANELSRFYCEKGLNRQSWEISKKIKQADMLMSRTSSLQERIRETHPEVCFCALNGGYLQYGKKRNRGVGLQERREILQRYVSDVREVEEEGKQRLGGQVQRDDILDAIAASVTAMCGQGGIRSLPAIPDFDEVGLRMEIVYWPRP